jgi:cytochrome c oxidase subunit 2
MIGKVTVMDASAYQAWLGGGTEGPLSVRGERLFSELACNTCHRDDGTGRGPSLANKFGSQEKLADGASVRVDESYIRESILTPQAKLVAGYQPLMPTFQGLLNEQSVMALIEYVKSLQPAQRAAGESAAAEPVGGGREPAAPENR